MSHRTYPSGFEKRKKAALLKKTVESVPQLTQFFPRITPSTSDDTAVGHKDCNEDVVHGSDSDQSDDESNADLKKMQFQTMRLMNPQPQLIFSRQCL